MTVHTKTREEPEVKAFDDSGISLLETLELPDVYSRLKQAYLHPGQRTLVSGGLMQSAGTRPNPWYTTDGTDEVNQGELDWTVFALKESTNTMPLKIEVVQQIPNPGGGFPPIRIVGLKCDKKMEIRLPFGFWKTVEVDYFAKVPLSPPPPFVKNPYGVIKVISGPSLFGPDGPETTQQTSIEARKLSAPAVPLKADPGIRSVIIEPATHVNFHLMALICSG